MVWPTNWNSSDYNMSRAIESSQELMELILRMITDPPEVDNKLVELFNLTNIMEIFQAMMQTELEKKCVVLSGTSLNLNE